MKTTLIKSIFILSFAIFSNNAFATYCSLTHPEFCPKQNTGTTVTNNNNPVIKNNFDPSIKTSQRQNQNQFQSQKAISNSSAAATANSSATSGASISGMNGNGGQSNVTTGDVSTSFQSNQVRQTPFAYSPSVTLGYNRYKCNDSVSVGVSAGFGAIGGGAPIGDEICEILVAADVLDEQGYHYEACETRMQVEYIAAAFTKTGRTCKAMFAVIPAPVQQSSSTWLAEFNKKYPPINQKLDSIHQDQMMK